MKRSFIFIFTFLLMGVLTLPAVGEVKIGGSVYTDFYYYDRDAEDMSGGVRQGTAPTEDDWKQTIIEVPTHSGFSVEWDNEDNVGMLFVTEIAGARGVADFNLLESFGWWEVTPSLTILAGHTGTALSALDPDQMIGKDSDVAHDGGQGFGNLAGCEVPQVGLIFKFSDRMELAIALVDPGNGADDFPNGFMQDPNNVYANAIPADPNTGLGAARLETKIPRVDIGGSIKTDAMAFYPSFSWQEKTYDQAAAGNDDHVTSYVFAFSMEACFGPFSLAGEMNWGENWGNANYGDNHWNSDATIYQDGAGNWKVSNTECMAWWVDLAFQRGPATVHAIYGWERNKGDNGPGVLDDFEYTTQMYGMSVLVELAKGFSIRPEMMIYDLGDDNKQNGDNTLYDYGKEKVVGVQFAVEF